MTVSTDIIALSIYDPLVDLTQDGIYEPFLAESIEPNDDLTHWTVILRDDVVFHDGTKLDAEAVKWNFDNLHMVDGSTTRSGLTNAGVEDVRVIDELTLEYSLAWGNAAFPDVLKGPAGWPVSPTAYEKDPDGFGMHPVGTGPFMMVERQVDDHTTVKRNPDYWRSDDSGNQLPYLDELIFRPITEETSRVQALGAGDVQVVITLRGTTVEELEALKSSKDIEIITAGAEDAGAAIFNAAIPPTDDLRVRRAALLSANPEAIQAVLGESGATLAKGYFVETSPWYSEAVADAEITSHPRDTAAAAKLIDEYKNDPNRSDGKGPGDPVVIEFSCVPDASLLKMSQVYQELWNEAGITTDIKQLEYAIFSEYLRGTADTSPAFVGEYQAACSRVGVGTDDPYTYFSVYFGDPASTPGNVTNLTDPDIDAALEILRSNTDFQTRYDAVETIGKVVAEEAVILWDSFTPSTTAFLSNVVGLDSWTLPSGSSGRGLDGARIRFYEAQRR